MQSGENLSTASQAEFDNPWCDACFDDNWRCTDSADDQKRDCDNSTRDRDIACRNDVARWSTECLSYCPDREDRDACIAECVESVNSRAASCAEQKVSDTDNCAQMDASVRDNCRTALNHCIDMWCFIEW